MNQAEFAKAVAGLPLAKYAFFPSIGSTNDEVAEWARQGVQGLALAAADEQTRGRGRAGRRWLTPPGSALAFSILLDLAAGFDASRLGCASGLGALAVCEALETLYKLSPQIKWPNDVLLDGMKACGVLPEAHWTGSRLRALILGIGINIAPDDMPPQEALSFPATCVEEALGSRIKPGDLLRGVLERIFVWKDRLATVEFLEAWQGRLAYLGENVHLDVGKDRIIEAQLEGLAADGSLRLRLSTGELRAFQMGEIQIRPLAKK
ncbi:MAG: biotin--[acetyl-CoA-carboxylase] ligase [Anaerolineales bacterium]